VLKEVPNGKESTSIKSDCTVDLRRFMEPEDANALGNFACVYDFDNVNSNQLGEEFAEAVARDFNAGLQKALLTSGET
jgi:NRPS condensation-like uncharacterized protein